MQEKKFIKRELEKKDFTHKDAIRAVKCWYVVHTDLGGYTEDELDFHLWENGAIAISGNSDGQFIMIEDQKTLDILREFLK